MPLVSAWRPLTLRVVLRLGLAVSCGVGIRAQSNWPDWKPWYSSVAALLEFRIVILTLVQVGLVQTVVVVADERDRAVVLPLALHLEGAVADGRRR